MRNGCLMLKLKENKILNNPNFLDHEDVEEFEDYKHCTILYGLDIDEIDLIEFIEKVKEHKINSITAKEINLFENDTDVLKIEVELDGGLNKLYETVSGFPNNNEYDEYKPHVTIAYLKKGFGEKYLGVEKSVKFAKNISFEVESYHLSIEDEKGKEIDIYF